MKVTLLFGILSLGLISSINVHAQNNMPVTDPGFHVAPGTIGPNAFTNWIWRVDDARVIPGDREDPDRIAAKISYRDVKDKWGSHTNTGVAQIEIPFSALSSVELTYLAESWKLNNQGMAQLQPTHSSGMSVGDLIAAYKLRLLKENDRNLQPSVALHISVKTASGGFDDRRFTDSTGYTFDVLVAKDIIKRTGVLKTVRVLGEAGFMAWDDGAHAQNDAYRYGLAVRMDFSDYSTVTLGYHGYTGWQHNGDRPATLYLEGQKPISKNVAAFSAIDLGTKRDANPLTFTGGARILIHRFPAKKNKIL